MDQCSDILRDGVFQQYTISNHSEFRSRIRSVFEYDFDALREARDQGALGVDVIGIVDVFVGGDSEDYEELREKVRATQDEEFDAILSIEISSRVASPEIVAAWTQCMHRQNPSDVGLRALGASGNFDNFDEFALRLSYVPDEDTDPDEVTITRITPVGIEFVDTGFLTEGRTLRKFSSLTARVRRTTNDEISMSVDFSGRASVDWSEPALVQPHEYAWHRTNEAGQAYVKTFSHNTGPGRPRTIKSGIYRLGIPNARIYRVDFRHEGAARAWNYHTTNGHGREYEGDTTIIEDGAAFIWRRIWEGADVTEYYSARYEVWR